MAHYFLFPEKDATIYSHPTNQSTNTGIDEILTIRDEQSFTDNNYYPSRILIQFKNNEVNSVINDRAQDKTIITASLKLYQTEHRELSIDQHLEAYPLAESWVNGTGRLDNEPKITDGVSWLFRDGSENSVKLGAIGTVWSTSSLPSGATGSWTDDAKGGGIWYTGSGFEVNRTYGYNDELDISLNVTSPVLKHYSASNNSATYPNGITNNGFILKRSESQEFTAISDGELNFFSVDTHTIYPAYLDISWDDSDYDTSAAIDSKILKTGDIYVTLRNNKQEFKTIEEPKFRLNVRELYPTRRFVTSSNFLDVKYFTSKSFYSLVDYATEETVIPFGPTSKLSADSEGMYFKLYMNGLQEERYYKLLFKHENNDGIRVYDENCYFKIVKS
jgi:hypothetical protein